MSPIQLQPGEIPWYMTEDQADLYFELSAAWENYEISDEEFAAQLAELPGYPLPGLPNPDAKATLRIIIKRRSPQVAVPRSYAGGE